MLLPEKLAYTHSAISLSFALLLIRHYRRGDKDPSVKSRLLISCLLIMSAIAVLIGVYWPDYHA